MGMKLSNRNLSVQCNHYISCMNSQSVPGHQINQIKVWPGDEAKSDCTYRECVLWNSSSEGILVDKDS